MPDVYIIFKLISFSFRRFNYWGIISSFILNNSTNPYLAYIQKTITCIGTQPEYSH